MNFRLTTLVARGCCSWLLVGGREMVFVVLEDGLEHLKLL